MISKLSYKKISTLLGWCSFALLLVFIANIAIGKYMHLKKMSIVSPINGVEEFLLFGLIAGGNFRIAAFILLSSLELVMDTLIDILK